MAFGFPDLSSGCSLCTCCVPRYAHVHFLTNFFALGTHADSPIVGADLLAQSPCWAILVTATLGLPDTRITTLSLSSGTAGLTLSDTCG